jgi:hypothetical protein
MKPLQHLSDPEFEHLASQAARLPDAPPALRRSAVTLWATRPSATGLMARADRVRRQILAALTFDSAATSGLALGMRGSAAAARHLVCSAPGLDVDVRVTPAAGRFDVSGQVLGTDRRGVILLTALGGGDDALAVVDGSGEFRLPGLSRGRYRLTLRIDEGGGSAAHVDHADLADSLGDDIVLPEIELGTAARA